MTSKENLLSAIKKNMTELQNEFISATTKSWKEKVASMPNYAPLPKRGCFYDNENRAAYNARLEELRYETLDLVQSFRNSLNADISAAPSEEAVRALQTFAMLPIETIGKEDYARRVNALAERYGNNAMFSESLRTMAAKNEVFIEEHPAIKGYNEAARIEQSVNHFFNKHHVHSCGYGAAQEITDGEIAFTFSGFANMYPNSD